MTLLRIAVAGASGYVGGELLRLLLAHPDVEIGALTAASSAGDALGQHQPHLIPLADRIIAPTNAETLAGHDVVFLGLPHGASAEVAEGLSDQTLVIDCGADFRLDSSDDWTQFYGGDHAGTWPYGMPELPGQRAKLVGAKRIAGPGCFPTVSTLSLMPAVANNLIADDIVIVAAAGTSGAGKALKPHLLGSEVMGNVSAYGVGGVHRHTPEIEQNLRLAGAKNPRISFTPLLVPTPRGILATCSASVAAGVDLGAVRAAYNDNYANEPFVQVLPAGQWPQTKAVLGANTVHLQVAIDERAGRLIAVGAMDNLAKGTAGGAIQSMNIALQLEETRGLSTIGVAP